MKTLQVISLLCLSTAPATASESTSFHVVYQDPAAPQTSWFTIAELPSFLFMPGVPVWRERGVDQDLDETVRPITYAPGATGAQTTSSSGGDLDCKDIGHRVEIVDGNDPYHLDGDGDGIGCEAY